MVHVTVPAEDPAITYTVTTPQTVFTIPEYVVFWAEADLRVYTVVDGAYTEIPSTGWSFTGSYEGGYAGGELTLAVAVSDCEVRLYRSTDIGRSTDFPTGGPLDRDVLNTQVDQLAAQNVDAYWRHQRALRVPDYLVPVDALDPVAGAGKIIGFNALGTGFTTYALDDGPLTVASAAAAFAYDNEYPAALNGITPGMSGFAAALNALMASVAAAGGGVITLQQGTYTAETTLDNCYDGVLVRGPYMPVLNDAGAQKLSARIVASFAGTLAKRRSPYGVSNRKTRGGGFVNVTLDGGELATKCLEIDSAAFIDIAVYVTGCVGSVAVETICGVSFVDLAEACDVQYSNIHIVGRLIDTTAQKACDVVKFGGSSNANFSLNKNVVIYCQHWDGDAVHLYNSDNNELWVYAYRAGGAGYGVRAGGARSGGVLGSENNLIRFLTGAGGAYAEGTADSGVTSGVFNMIETLDKSNGTPDPTAGTGSYWRWDTGRGVSRGAAFGPMVIADSDASAISERASLAAGRTLVIRNGSQGHAVLSDGTNIWGIDLNGSGGLRFRRIAGSARLDLPDVSQLSINGANVTYGANDSGGVGFKLIRVPN